MRIYSICSSCWFWLLCIARENIHVMHCVKLSCAICCGPIIPFISADNRCSQKATDETFFFSNIVPQNSQNNSGFWFKMERFCRKLAKKYSDVYVVSGPLYLPTEVEKGKTFVKYQVSDTKHYLLSSPSFSCFDSFVFRFLTDDNRLNCSSHFRNSVQLAFFDPPLITIV